MDEQLKQRLVGITVLTAIAAIFIPMLFNEPISSENNYSHAISLPVQTNTTLTESIQRIPTSKDNVITAKTIAPKALSSFPAQPQPTQEQLLKKWEIKVGSFRDKENALEFERRLRAKKFSAYVKTIHDTQGTLFQLRVGPELDYTRAKNEQKRLHSLFKAQTQLHSK